MREKRALGRRQIFLLGEARLKSGELSACKRGSRLLGDGGRAALISVADATRRRR